MRRAYTLIVILYRFILTISKRNNIISNTWSNKKIPYACTGNKNCLNCNLTQAENLCTGFCEGKNLRNMYHVKCRIIAKKKLNS